MSDKENENKEQPTTNAVTHSSGDIFTIEAAAALLGITTRTLGDKIRAGEVRAYKRAGRWYLLHEDLLMWVKSGANNMKRPRKGKNGEN